MIRRIDKVQRVLKTLSVAVRITVDAVGLDSLGKR